MLRSHVRWTEPCALTVWFTYCIYFNHRRLHCYNLVTTAENRRNHAIRLSSTMLIQYKTVLQVYKCKIWSFGNTLCSKCLHDGLLFLIVVLFWSFNVGGGIYP